MEAQPAEARYQLTLVNYPNSKSITQVCWLIYECEEKKLLAALSSLPYVVGRTYSHSETDQLHLELKKLGVAHRLKPNHSMAPLYTYDPQATTADLLKNREPGEIETSVQRFKNLPKKTYSIALVIFLAGGFFYFQSRKPTPPIQNIENFEAKLQKVKRDVEYRIADDLLWKKATDEIGLRPKDAIRTFQDSTAVLIYKEGSRLHIQPNSLLIVGKKTSSDDKLIKLEDGTIQARIKASDVPHHLSIETSSGTLEMTSPKPGEVKEMKVETSLAKGTLTVSVTQGQVKLTPRAKDVAPITLNSLQQLTATETSISPPRAFEPTFKLLSPLDNTKISSDPLKNIPTTFAWEGVGEEATYELTLATDSQMKNILLKEKTPKTELELSYVDLGRVYWQVTSTLEGTTYKSPIWQIHVEKPNE